MHSTFIVVAICLAASSEAFAPPTTPAVRVSMSLQLGIMGTEVSPAVIAAVGVALVGGIGAATISSKLGAGEDKSAPPAASSSSSPSSAGDISIPYDAAAKLAYEQAGSLGDYAAFKSDFESDATALVVAKKEARDAAAIVGSVGRAATSSSKLGAGEDKSAPPAASSSSSPSSAGDISIPYDAAAKLAYEQAGSLGDYAAFKSEFESDAIALVVAKKEARDAA